MADTSTAPIVAPTTNTFAAGDTASGVAAKNGMSAQQFLSYNPALAADKNAPHPNDYKGLTGLVQIGQPYKLAPDKSQLSVTSGQSIKNFADNTSALTGAINALGNPAPLDPGSTNDSQDPVITSITGMHATADAATKSLLATTLAAYQNKQNTVNKSYNNYKAGLESLGIEHNAAQGTPELLAGQIQTVAQEQTAKIDAITASMHKALIDSQTATQNNDFKTQSELALRYEKLKTDRTTAIKNMYDTITTQKTATTDEASVILGAIKQYNLSPKLGPNGEKSDQELYLEAVSKQTGLPLAGLVQALSTLQQTETAKSATETAKTSTEVSKDLTIKQKEYNLAHPKTPAGKTATFKAPAAIAQLTPLMEKAKGADNYVAPETWIANRTTWMDQGGSESSYKSNFLHYLNPASYTKAGYKAVKTPAGTGAQTA